MRKITILLISLLTTLTTFAQQRIHFNVRYSEPYATYDFFTKISDNYPDNDLKAAFLKSKYNTEFYKKQINGFAMIPVDYSYFYNQYPTPLKVGLMSRDILEKNLAISETVAEFQNRSLGILPNEDLSAFSQTLQEFTLIYRDLIFEPNKPAFAKQKSSLEKYVSDNKFADFFETGLSFYGTKWDSQVPFELDLLPSLEKNNLGARAFVNVAVCEASLDLKDHKILFSVAMHEIYHIIYDNQSLALKTSLQQWFDKSGSKNSQYALLLLNEVLATALGNAYVMEQLNNTIDEQDWYDDYYITAMAKQIYPLVKEYIHKKQPIDENFVKAYVEKYDIQFPQWAKELKHLLAYRYIVADDANDLRYFRKNYRKYSNNRSGAPISATEIEKMKAQPFTKVLVVSQNNKQMLQLIKASFEELKNIKLHYKDEFIEVVHLKDNTKLILINRYKSSTEDLMNRYFPEKKIK